MVEITIEEATDVARRLMYELLGRRWVWPAISTTETLDVPSGQKWVSLEGRPIITVRSVTLSRPGAAPVEIAYEVENKRRLRFTGSPYYNTICGGGSLMRVTVDYSYGSKPPLEVEKAIEALADQIFAAYTDPENCELPETVTSISRQGISMQMLTASDLLEKGLIGIGDIDRAISHFNSSKAVRRAKVFGAAKPPPRRKNTTQAAWP
ncbi:head-tail adaptor [Gordonia phage GMA2]|uniref:Uncharacterized protein n=1 Tax=Gordonia phage GMA2 TaxID=1647283 RepID=A0A0K0N742_9CAUD|nr:head-tail adaptor [Gordonia phage GMA2]AKJ72557.1 hypothetical protein GMA2_19 [Gordonia phage GMA2]